MAVAGINGVFTTGGLAKARRGAGSARARVPEERSLSPAVVFALVALALALLCASNLVPAVHCAAEGPVGAAGMPVGHVSANRSAGNASLSRSATECSNSSADDRLFERFFDSQCLAALEGAVACPLDDAHGWWQAVSGELRFDTLLMNTLSWVGLACAFFAGGVPDHREEPQGEWKALARCGKALFLLLWYSLQICQVLVMLLSLLSIVFGYAGMAHHYAPCLRGWVGARLLGGAMREWKVLHLVVLPTGLLHPLVFMRVAVIALGFSAATISMAIISRGGRRLFRRAEKLMVKVIRAFVWMQLCLLVLLWLCSLVLLLLPIGIVAATVVVLTFLGLWRSRTKPNEMKPSAKAALKSCFTCSCSAMTAAASPDEDQWGMLSWIASDYEEISPRALKISLDDLLWGFNKDCANIQIVIYSFLLTSIISPMLVIGLWLIVESLGCDQAIWETLTALYHFMFASCLDYLRLPDILALLKEFPPDFSAVLEWITNIDKYLDFDPALILRNARMLTSIQTCLAILKVAITAINGLLEFLTVTGCCVKTVAIFEILYGEVPKEELRASSDAFIELSAAQRNNTELAAIAFDGNASMLLHARTLAVTGVIAKRTLKSVAVDVVTRPDVTRHEAIRLVKHIIQCYVVESGKLLGEEDRDVVNIFLELDPIMTLQNAPYFQNDFDVVLAAFRANKEALKVARRAAVKDIIEEEDPFALQHAAPPLRGDDRLVSDANRAILKAYKDDPQVLQHADCDAVKYVIQNHDAAALQYACEEVRRALQATTEGDGAEEGVQSSSPPARPSMREVFHKASQSFLRRGSRGEGLEGVGADLPADGQA